MIQKYKSKKYESEFGYQSADAFLATEQRKTETEMSQNIISVQIRLCFALLKSDG